MAVLSLTVLPAPHYFFQSLTALHFVRSSYCFVISPTGCFSHPCLLVTFFAGFALLSEGQFSDIRTI